MLTGRNPHTVHIGGHATAAREGFLAHDARIPAGAGTIAANLNAAGYATFALGKWDHLPNEEASPAGPFTRWAQGQGFEQFYGFMAADADQWNPVLYRGTTPVMKPKGADYHVSADLADQAIAMIDQRSAPGEQGRTRPFFMYWATGAAHAPHHAPKEWIERYKGKFDQGWDAARAAVLKSQIAAGLAVGLALVVVFRRVEGPVRRAFLARSLMDQRLLLLAGWLSLVGLGFALQSAVAAGWTMPSEWAANAAALHPGVQIAPLQINSLVRDASLLLGFGLGALALRGFTVRYTALRAGLWFTLGWPWVLQRLYRPQV